MSDALLHLRRSENGHFVLVEPTSQTVVVAEELGEAYARMCETLKEAPPPATPAPAPALFEKRARVQIAVVIVALLVPLAWTAAIALEVRQASLGCPPQATRSQGHPTRVAPTPSAFADRKGTQEDDEGDEENTGPGAEAAGAEAAKGAEGVVSVEAVKSNAGANSPATPTGQRIGKPGEAA